MILSDEVYVTHTSIYNALKIIPMEYVRPFNPYLKRSTC